MTNSLDTGHDLLDLLHEAVLELDADSRVTSVNRGAVELYGWPPEDLVGRDLHEVLGTTFPTSRAEVEDALHTEGYWSGEVVHRKADGTTVTVDCRRAVRREDGRIVGFVEVGKDITERVAIRTEMESAEQHMTEVLDRVKDYAIYMLDPDGRIARCSASARQHTGHTDVDLLGRPWSMLFTPDAHLAGRCEDLLSRSMAAPLQLTGEVVRKDGSAFPVIGTLSAMRQYGSMPAGFAAVLHDDSERRHEETKLRGLLDSAADAMIAIDADGVVVFANLQAEALFGYPRVEMLGHKMEMLLPEDVRERHVGHRRGFMVRPKARPLHDLELRGRHRNGSEFPVEVSIGPVETRDGRIASAAIRDITDRKQAQHEIELLNAELRHANDELESRVAERTVALATQAATLKTINDELESFSYSVSHDLRAPLRAIDGFAKVLATRHAGTIPDEGMEYLEKIRAGAKQMGMLIDGLLAFSRLQRQALVSTRVDMGALVRDVWEELAPERAGRAIEFEVADLPPASADPRLLRHVLSNLLSNSMKYSRTRSPARITVGADRSEHGTPVYFVRDNGVGFDMRYADKLFKVFQRMHRAEEFEGTGIGLALVARIVNRHGGRVWADAVPGGGATFSFTLGP